jgi:hypothetical protein
MNAIIDRSLAVNKVFFQALEALRKRFIHRSGRSGIV